MADETISLTPIGRISSPFKERFGIPRQAGLVPAARGTVHLPPPWGSEASVRGLRGFSHIWVITFLHESSAHGWRATVRPPRLGGNRRVGVFASRSPFRPNSLGLSVFELLDIVVDGEGVHLAVSGLDVLDGTPVLDVKPYVPYADSLAAARGGFAGSRPGAELEVGFRPEAVAALEARLDAAALQELIVQAVSLDPRPAYRTDADDGPASYGMRMADVDVTWTVVGGRAWVERIESA